MVGNVVLKFWQRSWGSMRGNGRFSSGNVGWKTRRIGLGDRSMAHVGPFQPHHSSSDGVRKSVEHVCGRLRRQIGEDKLSYLIHCGNILALIGVSSHDMLTLRLFMISATSFGLAYNMLQPRPLWAPASWGIFFICIHSYQIYKLLLKDENIDFSPNEETLYDEAFLPYGFTPREFKTLMEKGKSHWETYAPGDKIVQEGWGQNMCCYLFDGVVDITKNGHTINRIRNAPDLDDDLKRGMWIGAAWNADRDFSHSLIWPVTCIARSKVTMVTFNLRDLHQAIESDPKTIVAAERLQIKDLWGKLQRTHSLFRDKADRKKKQISVLREKLNQQTEEIYAAMVLIAVSDGILTEEELRELKAYREEHAISDEAHERALKLAHWDKPFQPSFTRQKPASHEPLVAADDDNKKE